ncbi:hypothetical protein [Oceanobacillus kapialis]|uniref:Uncharacterized protein n=1 Tax=Oceanobacillus kapialis TaxID=481353 RepID=A0ABW5PZC8_9BACI
MKKSFESKDLVAILIPMGMMIGCIIGIISGMFFWPDSLGGSLNAGATIGFLVGIIAYAIFSSKEES